MIDFESSKIRRFKKLFTFSVMLITIFGIIAIAPNIKGQTEASPIPTNAYLAVSPNPVGVNQEVTCMMWLLQINPTAQNNMGGKWENYRIEITKPDGSRQTLGPFTADDASYAHAIFTPDQIGTYTLEFIFPGQHVTGANFVGIPFDTYYAESSFTVTLTAQQEPVEPRPQVPSPEGYWSRPINAQNFDWYTISGNWLGTGVGSFGTSANSVSGNINLYTTVPNTAHVVWTKPLMFGGLIGGKYGGSPTSHYYNGKSYEPAYGPPLIINGVLYYNDPATPRNGFYAVDLRSGETLWHQNSSIGISTGQILNFLSINQEGGIPYLWDKSGNYLYMNKTTWTMFDAVTGNMILQITNVPAAASPGMMAAGSTVEGPNGELLVYAIDSTNNWLALWNSTLCIQQGTPASPFVGAEHWRPPVGSILDWEDGVMWNVTIPSIPGQSITRIGSGILLATTASIFPSNGWHMEAGYDMNTGRQLWIQNRTTYPGATIWGMFGPVADGVFTEFRSNTMQWYGYDVYTGEQIWGPSEPYENAWGSIAINDVASESAYGILYAFAIDGIHALDMQTGDRLWDFYGDPAGADFPGFSTLPFETNMLYTVADEKVIAGTGDSHGVPQFRGARLYVIDNSGQEVWSINGYFEQSLPVAEGYLVGYNLYDNMLYCFGKGQTETTVSGPEVVQPLGTEVLIKGTVTDQSPGETCFDTPIAGTPAIADEYMSEWMEYLHMQQSLPKDAEGVEVVLTTYDPNGNTYEIGRTTSTDRGTFGCEVDLPVPGLYKIIATFEGSDSYYASSAETYVSVTESSSPGQQLEPQLAETIQTAETSYIATELMIIIAIAIIAVIVLAGFYIFRKQQ